MKKITLNDFSGGIQELTSPVDFTSRQWAQLHGIVPRNARIFESQWPIQTIGTAHTGFTAVWPLVCEAGVYLIGIKGAAGTLWWAKAPSHNDAYGTSNLVSWTQITAVENYKWTAGNVAQTLDTLVNNPEYRFLCSVPVQAYKYVRIPNATYPSNVVLDTDGANQSSQFSGVLISTAEKNSGNKSTQAVIVYVDTNNTPSPTVRAVSFPNQRRIPTHKWDKIDGQRKSDFINGLYIDNDGNPAIDTMPNWPFDPTALGAPANSMQPFLWYDVNGQEQPGRGIIPRANVGCTKGNKLVLGDIEWRKDFSTELPTLDSRSLATLSTTAVTLDWPDDVEATGRVIYNLGPGKVYLSDSVTAANIGDKRSVVARRRVGTTVRLYLKSSIAGIVVGTTTIVVSGVKNTYYNGTGYTITGTGTASFGGKTYNYIEYTHPKSLNVAVRTSGGKVLFQNLTSPTNFDIEIPIGGTAAIPNDWVEISAVSDTAKTVIQALKNRNLGVHFLNDNNTGPMRSGIYYGAGDLDEFDPRSVKQIGRSDIRIAGLHNINDTVIAITTAGGEGDGVFRIRGYFAAEYPYDGSTPNPNAISIELIKGGVGAPNRTTLTGGHKAYSCLWQSTSTVVFIDRLGGIYYTDGRVCDRLDRYGPRKPSIATDADHTASVGDHLFAYRDGRLLCFSLLASNGTAGEGCWTEIVKPSGTILSMSGAREDLYFVSSTTGTVMRIATAGLDAERGCIDGVAQTLTVSTATIGSEDEHDRTNWDKFGMTFSTPTSCTVATVRVQSNGALDAGPTAEDGSTDPVKHTTTLNRAFSNSNVTGEFVVNTGIGPQNKISATVTFTGYVRLESAAFWTTGREPRRGDK